VEDTIRKMTENDWSNVYAIYKQGMETNLATFSVEEITYDEFSEERLPEGRFVYETKDKKIAGWTTLKQSYDIPEYYGVCEVSIYVDEKFRGKGIATSLLNHLIAYSEKAGIWMLEADIFANNKGSIAVHEKCGFRKVGYREKMGRDQFGTWRDAVLLERRSKIVGVD